nr:MAG TPA: hypothetical protein [Caudoviricetes sp.]
MRRGGYLHVHPTSPPQAQTPACTNVKQEFTNVQTHNPQSSTACGQPKPPTTSPNTKPPTTTPQTPA